MQQPLEKHPQTFLRLLIKVFFFWGTAMLYAWNAVNLWIKEKLKKCQAITSNAALRSVCQTRAVITTTDHQAYPILHNNYLWFRRGVLSILKIQVNALRTWIFNIRLRSHRRKKTMKKHKSNLSLLSYDVFFASFRGWQMHWIFPKVKAKQSQVEKYRLHRDSLLPNER